MLRAAEGSSSTSRSTLTSSGAGTLYNGMYGSLYSCMYVCMYSSWLLIDGSHIYALQEFSHHGQTCEGAGGCRLSAGISNLLANS